MGPLIEAIYAGNGIVIKGSEQTAWSSDYTIQVARAALSACGHDPDLVQVSPSLILSTLSSQNIICLPDVAEYLTSHPEISHILFIGSKPVAHKVAQSAAKVTSNVIHGHSHFQTLTRLTLELGGKDAVIVLNDVYDVKAMCAILMRGVFQVPCRRKFSVLIF